MPKYCPECGVKIEGEPKFCPECGNKLTRDIEPEPIKNTSTDASSIETSRLLGYVYLVGGIISIIIPIFMPIWR